MNAKHTPESTDQVEGKRIRSEYWKARSEKRRQDPVYRAKQAEWNKAWRELHAKTHERLARKAEQMRSYSQKEEICVHRIARRKVRTAIENGSLIRQSCEVCGNKKTHAHHDDYSRPLEVRWLCHKHHAEHHAKATGQ